MGKFKDDFAEPMYFTGNMYVINGGIKKKDAAKMFADYIGGEVSDGDLRSDFVRFGYPPEGVDERELLGACWYSGAKKGKGAMPVWVLDL